VQTLAGINVSVVAISNSVSPIDAAQRMAQEPLVEYAEPNYLLYALDHDNGDYVVNDPRFNEQYGPQKIQAPGAWRVIANRRGDVSTATATVNIAICDTGVDLDHPELQGKIKASVNFSDSPDEDDHYGHGTHVAGIAAAATNNGEGIAGVGFSANLLNVKVLGDFGSGSTSGVAAGIRWAADNGADVINLSLGSAFGSSTLKAAVDYAWSKGVVIVAAAGNSGDTRKFYPAAYDNCIAVAATDANDQLAPFSTRGSWVDIAAPGVAILSTLPNHPNAIGGQDYGNLDGTSMASPHVAGAVALVMAAFPDKTDAAFFRNQVQNTADAVPGLNIAGGRLNAHSAMKEGSPPPPPPPAPTLKVTVKTDAPTYSFGDLIFITVTVTDGSQPVRGASVTLRVDTPSGKSFTERGKTNAQGKYIVIGLAAPSDGVGTYTATATASKTGYTSGSDSTTFTVQ